MNADNKEKDYCCFAVKDAGDAAATNPSEPAGFACRLWTEATTDAKDADIRAAEPNTDRYEYDAWMWNGGVSAAADSDTKAASMISMALTTIVTIAVAAY